MAVTRKYGLYAVLFENKIIKVGKSTDLQERVKKHIETGRGFMVKAVDVAINAEPSIDEEDLIGYCQELCDCTGGVNHYGEWFRGIPFDLVRACVLGGEFHFPSAKGDVARKAGAANIRQLSLLDPILFKGIPRRLRHYPPRPDWR